MYAFRFIRKITLTKGTRQRFGEEGIREGGSEEEEIGGGGCEETIHCLSII
jgi:hypothetical protein